MIVRHHGHHSPHTLLVLGGSIRCGDVDLGPGDHVELPLGASFGPFEAGPEGAELYEVMMGDPRSWSDDEDSMVALLAARGAERLPDPPIDLPGGLEDLRQVYARAEALAARPTLTEPRPGVGAPHRLGVGAPMWANRDWIGRSLPADTPAGRELDAYARVVNAVEGNTTFYATPDAPRSTGGVPPRHPAFVSSSSFPVKSRTTGVCATARQSSGRSSTASNPSGIVSVR